MTILINNESAMERFGEHLANRLRPGDAIELIGDVGAGKTTLTRAIARGLGFGGEVQSPTFAISNRYQLPNDMMLLHYDFYRLTEPGIMQQELQESLADGRNIVIIEWGDIIRDIMPVNTIRIYLISPTEQSRELNIKTSDAMMARLESLDEDFC